MSPAQLERLRSVATGTAQGGTMDNAWRALRANGYVRNIGRGAHQYSAIYEITDDGRAVLEAIAAAEAAA